MAQFKFNLEGVLRQRENAEHIAQRELALAMQKVNELKDQLRRLDDNVKSVTEDVRQNHLSGVLDVSFIAGHRRYLLSMERNALELARKIADAQSIAEKARQIMVEKSRDTKIIEKLRDKQHQRWKDQQNIKENAAGDEAGMQIAYANLVEGTT